MAKSPLSMGACATVMLLASCAGMAPRPGTAPVIDMHVHAGPGTVESVIYEVRPGEMPDEARERFTLDEMDANGVSFAMLSGIPAYTSALAARHPERFLAGIMFPCGAGLTPRLDRCFEDGGELPDLAWLRVQLESGRIGAFGEMTNVYAGISPQDPRMQPYFDLAAEFDLIVAVHADQGPPPRARLPGCCPDFTEAYADPGLYREVLRRHPQLRLYLMHIIRPESTETAIELMREYPNVYMDTSPMSQIPPEQAHAALRRVVEAGFGDRILFGSDFLGRVRDCLQVIESADFLSPAQKRAILHDNAVRFLRRK